MTRAEKELNRRWQAAIQGITAEAIADGHEYQYQLLTTALYAIIAMCSRRAGKTWALCGLLLLTAIKTPNVSCLYLALTAGQARKVYNRIWFRLLRRFGILKLCKISATEQSVTFPNGSTVVFGGVDDLRHVQTLLGDSMAGGIAIVDEAQSGDRTVLKTLVLDILDPMLHETNKEKPEPGKLVISGTVPEVAAGFLYETWQKHVNEEDSEWLCLNWNRFQNPHTNSQKELEKYLKKHSLLESDPIVQRNWFGRLVYDPNATAFRYQQQKSGWKGNAATWANSLLLPPGKLIAVTPPPGVNTYSIGLDPAATSDRFGIVVWGWSSKEPQGVWQVAEWVTEKGANALESQYMAALRTLVTHYGNVVSITWDPGGPSTTLDPSWLSEYGLVIEPAKKGKGSKKARVDRLADLLGTGRAHVLIGSELERDLMTARFDDEKRADGKYEWTSDCHPDVADAATYALPAYIEAAKVKPKEQTKVVLKSGSIVIISEKEAEAERLSFSQPSTGGYGYQDPEQLPGDTDDGGYGGIPQ